MLFLDEKKVLTAIAVILAIYLISTIGLSLIYPTAGQDSLKSGSESAVQDGSDGLITAPDEEDGQLLPTRDEIRAKRFEILKEQMTARPRPDKKIIGYYAGWTAEEGFTPLDIDGSMLTHINYAFANIGDDLRVVMGDTKNDPDNFEDLLKLKELYPHLKTLISIGGWTWSGKFSDAAATAGSRANFAESAVAFMKEHGFDGIDIDWEYPVSGGLPENSRRPEDRTNFTLLLKQLRNNLDKLGKEDGRHYLLTIAGAAGRSYIENTEIKEIAGCLDYINVMTYDINGPWNNVSDFNAALFPNGAGEQWSVSQGIDIYLDAGVPADKIIMGIPFYGYKYRLTESDDAGKGLLHAFSSGEYIDYDSIAKEYENSQEMERLWDSRSKVPWLYGDNLFISYDNRRSISEKAGFAKDRNLGGMMIWELSNDHDSVLLEAIYDGLNKEPD